MYQLILSEVSHCLWLVRAPASCCCRIFCCIVRWLDWRIWWPSEAGPAPLVIRQWPSSGVQLHLCLPGCMLPSASW